MSKSNLPDLVTPALVSAGGSLINSGFSLFNAKNSADRSVANARSLMATQNMIQRQNNLDAMSLIRESKRRAGINLNADNGFSPSLQSPSATQTPVMSDRALLPDNLMGLMQGLSSIGLQKSQERKNNADSATQEYELEKRKKRDEEYSKVHQDENGNYVIDAPVISSYEDFEALKNVQNWNAQDVKNHAEMSQDRLRQAIADGQLQDNELFQKLLKLKPQEYDNLVATMLQSKAYKEFIDQQKETEKSKKKLVEAQTETEGTVQKLNKAKAETEGTVQDLNKARADSERENKKYIISKTALSDLQHDIERHGDLKEVFNEIKNADGFGEQFVIGLTYFFNVLSKMFSASKHF